MIGAIISALQLVQFSVCGFDKGLLSNFMFCSSSSTIESEEDSTVKSTDALLRRTLLLLIGISFSFMTGWLMRFLIWVYLGFSVKNC